MTKPIAVSPVAYQWLKIRVRWALLPEWGRACLIAIPLGLGAWLLLIGVLSL